VEGCVDVIQEPISGLNGITSSLSNQWPAIELLGYIGNGTVVVAVKGVEGAEGRPSSTE
jgi:hypothetical protein